MKSLYHPFWTSLTVVFSLLLIILLPGAIIEKHGMFKTVLYTTLGVLFIWITYLVRAYIFSGFAEKKEDKPKDL